MQTIQISNKLDLLRCKNIADQIIEHGKDNVKALIRTSIEKCALGLNITLSEYQVLTLCDDVLETYTYECLESVSECLKLARRGEFGFGMNSRSSLTMIHIREWMDIYLKEIREMKKNIDRIKNQLEKIDREYPEVDYEKYKEHQKENTEPIRKKKIEPDPAFEKFKKKYFEDQNSKNQDK